jgi:hypothetical protein
MSRISISMEASGVALRQTPKISGGILNERSVFVSNRSSVVAMVRGFRKVKKLRVRAKAMDLGFEDKASLLYYNGYCKERKKEIKNRLKVLSKDLIKLPITPDFTQSQLNTIKEATEILQMQLQQLKAEEKELKKQRKAELKATRMKKKKMADLGCESSSSSSSSESSDSDCGKSMVNNTARLKTSQNEFPAILEATTTLTLPISTTPHANLMTKKNVGTNYTNSIISSTTDINMSSKRIEVCMGNKCKKSGSAALLEEFTRVTGVEATVVGCKCMGKCRDGPNVRVMNPVDGLDDSVRTPPKSLCNRVGLENVGDILSNLGCYVDNGKGLRVLLPPLA